MIFLCLFLACFHQVKWTIFVNVNVLHQTGKRTAMSSQRIARDSSCYCLKQKEMHSTVERTSKKIEKVLSIVEWTSPHNKTEPLCRQKLNLWTQFFACPMYIEEELKLGYNKSAIHFYAIFTLYWNIGPQPATMQNTHIHTKPSWGTLYCIGMASIATKMKQPKWTEGRRRWTPCWGRRELRVSAPVNHRWCARATAKTVASWVLHQRSNRPATKSNLHCWLHGPAGETPVHTK